MARFTKNSKGLYRTGVVIGYDETGRIKRKWLSARTIAELERKIAEVKTALDSGRNLLDEDVHFGEYAEMWLATYKAKRGINTRQMYEHLIRKQFESIAPLKVREIRAITLQGLINSFSETPRTCEQMRMTLRQIFNQAIEDQIVSKNPAASLEVPRRVAKEKRALTAEEKAAVREADLTPYERAFLMILYGCGVRPGELYALTWEDVDFKKSRIRINKAIAFENNNKPVLSYPKTNKSIRFVEAPQTVIKALKEYRGTSIAPKLFGSRSGDYKGMTAYLKDWGRIKKKLEGVLGHETDLTMYCFRHNYASSLYYAGISLKEAQRLMGHQSYKMIMDVYAHLDAEKEDTAAKLNAIDF